MLTLFSKERVRTKRVDTDLNKAINQVQQLHHVADYTGDSPEMEKARWAVEQAENFVAAIRKMIASVNP